MVKTFAFFVLLLSSLYAGNTNIQSMPSMKGVNTLAIKGLLVKPPEELEPDLAVMVGGIYEHGMKELSVKKNINIAKKYYKSGANRGNIMGTLILANIALEEKDFATYEKNIWVVIEANDHKLSLPAGLHLATLYDSLGNKSKSMKTLQYLADNYLSARAQFLLGWNILYGNFKSKDISIKDAQFYLYRACNNTKASKEILKQCNLIKKYKRD